MNNIGIKEIVKSMPTSKWRTDKIDLWVFAFARPLSFPVAWVLLRLGISATGASVIALMTGALGSVLIAMPSYFLRLIGGLLVNLWIVFDCVDGNIARVTRTSSRFGELVDAASGYIFISILYTSLGIGSLWDTNTSLVTSNIGPASVYAGGIASVACILPRLIEHKACNLIPGYKSEITDKGGYGVLQIIVFNLTSMSGLSLPLLLVTTVLGKLHLYVICYAAFHSAIAVISIGKTFVRAQGQVFWRESAVEETR